MFFGKKINSNLALRLIALISLFSIAVCQSAVDPKAYASIYFGLIGSISDEQLLKNYHNVLKELQASGGQKETINGDELKLIRLPIFRVPVLKVIIAEMKRRNLITEAELKMVNDLIEQQEKLLKKGGHGYYQ